MPTEGAAIPASALRNIDTALIQAMLQQQQNPQASGGSFSPQIDPYAGFTGWYDPSQFQNYVNPARNLPGYIPNIGEGLVDYAFGQLPQGGDLDTGGRVFLTRQGYIFDEAGNLVDRITLPTGGGRQQINGLSRNGHSISVDAQGVLWKGRSGSGFDQIGKLSDFGNSPTELNGVIQPKGRTPIVSNQQLGTVARDNQTNYSNASLRQQMADYRTRALNNPRGSGESSYDWITRMGYRHSMPAFPGQNAGQSPGAGSGGAGAPPSSSPGPVGGGVTDSPAPAPVTPVGGGLTGKGSGGQDMLPPDISQLGDGTSPPIISPDLQARIDEYLAQNPNGPPPDPPGTYNPTFPVVPYEPPAPEPPAYYAPTGPIGERGDSGFDIQEAINAYLNSIGDPSAIPQYTIPTNETTNTGFIPETAAPASTPAPQMSETALPPVTNLGLDAKGNGGGDSLPTPEVPVSAAVPSPPPVIAAPPAAPAAPQGNFDFLNQGNLDAAVQAYLSQQQNAAPAVVAPAPAPSPVPEVPSPPPPPAVVAPSPPPLPPAPEPVAPPTLGVGVKGGDSGGPLNLPAPVVPAPVTVAPPAPIMAAPAPVPAPAPQPAPIPTPAPPPPPPEPTIQPGQTLGIDVKGNSVVAPSPQLPAAASPPPVASPPPPQPTVQLPAAPPPVQSYALPAPVPSPIVPGNNTPIIPGNFALPPGWSPFNSYVGPNIGF